MTTVVDSSVLVAGLHREDALHVHGKTALEESEKPILVPEYIAIETATTLIRVAGKPIADIFVRSLFDNKDILVLPSSLEQFAEAVETFLSSNGKLSFIDCSLLALSRSHEVVTFDKVLAKAIKALRKDL